MSKFTSLAPIIKREFNKIMIARVVDSLTPLKETIRVFVPFLNRNIKYNMYYKENEEFLVHDPNQIAKPGDIILIKELPQRLSLKINHGLEKVIYQSGNIIDPVTGKKCFGNKYVEDMESLGELLGQKPRYKIPQLESEDKS